jgi:hypothetical protein
MKNAQRPVLLKLRTLSKSFRAMADAQLAQHIIVAAPVGIAYLRVTAPGERRSMAIDEASASSPSPAEDGVPGMSARVLWNRDERRGLSRVLAGVKVLDIRGPARAREQDMGDIARQCRCAHTVRLRPDAAGLPPLHVPLPQSVTRLVAFTSLAADGDRAGAAGRSVSAGDSMSKAARRASWRGIAAARESTNVQAGETAYIGQVPGRVRDIVVTVRYPRAGAIRSLAPWDHPTSLESVTVIFVGSSGRRKARPRSFLIGSSGSAADASGSTPIWEQHARQSQSKRLSWLSASGISLFSSPSNTPTATPTKGSFPDFGPIDPAFPAVPAPIPEGVTSLSSLNSPGLGSPGTPGSPQSPVPQTPTTPQTPSFLFSPPDAHDPLGSLTLFVRSVASHLPRVTYTLVDAGRIEPTLLGLAQGTLLSPRQIERLLRRAVATELGRSGWDEEETEFLLENLKFMSTASYKAKVGDSAFALHTIE